MCERIQITKKMKGEDGHRVFSIRIKEELVEKLDEIATETDRSRNELISMFIEYCINHHEIVDSADPEQE